MKNKIKVTVLVCLILVMSVLIFTACNINHQHKEVIDPAIDSSCEKAGLTEGKHCSICDEIIVAQEVIPAKAHLYKNITCTVCGYTADHSEYFNFIPLKSGGYAVAGLKSSKDYPSELLIPSMYEGAPVTTIQFLIPSILNNATPSLAWDFEGPTERIESVVIPNGVTIIEEGAFSGLEGLSRITIPNSISFIGEGAFAGCDALKGVYISDLASWCEIEMQESYLFRKGSNLYCNGELIVDLVIPQGVTKISPRVFLGCDSIKSVTISDSVTTIGYDAFRGCHGLISVTIPGNVEVIGDSAFSNCENLETIMICKGVKRINENAFEYCHNLVSITIPDSVEFIGVCVFWRCDKLISLTYTGTTYQWESIHCASGMLYSWLDSSSFVRIICSDGVIWREDLS